MLNGVWLFVPYSAAERWLCVRQWHAERAAMAHVVVTIRGLGSDSCSAQKGNADTGGMNHEHLPSADMGRAHAR
jgi:hypothetical protein